MGQILKEHFFGSAKVVIIFENARGFWKFLIRGRCKGVFKDKDVQGDNG
jgi:hypothetical protein